VLREVSNQDDQQLEDEGQEGQYVEEDRQYEVDDEGQDQQQYQQQEQFE
jgi:hypothetical protein